MDPLNYNEKYEDLKKLEEYKVLNTYQKLMIMELKIISESLHDISQSFKINITNINYNNGIETIRLCDIMDKIICK